MGTTRRDENFVTATDDDAGIDLVNDGVFVVGLNKKLQQRVKKPERGSVILHYDVIKQRHFTLTQD